MHLPEDLQEAIDQITQHSPSLSKAREGLSQDYREGKASPFSDEAKRLAYLGARLPATYAAVCKVLTNLQSCEHFLDLGAGPGTASWAASVAFPDLKKITLVEKSGDAILLGKKLIESSEKLILKEAKWLHQALDSPLPEADVGLASYVFNEIKNPEGLISSIWKSVSTLIIIEPGTPRGFQLIRKLREQLIHLGAHIVAPCPHAMACPIQGTDWCHFSARVERTRLHRLLKGGSLGYEDEKFSYIIASKKITNPYPARILRHPIKQSGFVKFTLCTDKGILEEKTISRKSKEVYRIARDAEWGDIQM